MFRAGGVEILSIWAPIVLVSLLARRRRRLQYYLPGIGLVLGTLLLGGYGVYRAVGWEGELLAEVAYFHVVLALVSGFAWPMVLGWCRTLVVRGARRWRRRGKGEPAWWGACIGLGAVVLVGYFRFGVALEARGAFDEFELLFGADPPRYVHIMGGVARESEEVVHKHPAVALLLRGLAVCLTPVVGAEWAPMAVCAVGGAVGVVLSAWYFRWMLGGRLAAIVLAVVLAVTPAHVCFGATPESYSWAGAAMIMLHVLVIIRLAGWARMRHEALGGAFAAGVTLTLGLAGAVCVVVTRSRRRWGRTLQRWLPAVVGVVALAMIIQSALLPSSAEATHVGRYRGELAYAGAEAGVTVATRVQNVVRGLLLEGAVGPRLRAEALEDGRVMIGMGAYAGALERLCAGLWAVVLVGVGALVVVRREMRRPTVWAALLCVLLGGVQHLLYGNAHVFLFSSMYTFCLFAVVAHGLALWRARWRQWAVAGVGALMVANNLLFCRRLLAEVERVLAA